MGEHILHRALSFKRRFRQSIANARYDSIESCALASN